MLQQNLNQGQRLKILPQQLQMLQLFHLNTFELEQRIRDELEENPLIEENTEPKEIEESTFQNEDVLDYKDWDEYAYDDNYPTPAKHSGHEILINKYCAEDFRTGNFNNFRTEALQQLHILDLAPEENRIGEFIINSLTEEGFLEGTADALADEYSLRYTRLVQPEVVAKVVELVKGFEPVGLASSSIRECLLFQLKRMNKGGKEVKLAITILSDYYEELKSRAFEKLAHLLKIDESDIKNVLNLLKGLKLKPVSENNSDYNKFHTIVPDFVVTLYDSQLNITLFREKARSLKVNHTIKNKLGGGQPGRGNKAQSQAVAKKLNAAEWFVNAIKQRECVMLQVMEVIAGLQYEFFTSGDELLLKPMILKDVADRVGVDISTVSRITSNKYAQTPYGCVLLKKLFNEGIARKDGEMVNVKIVQETIRKVIQKESKVSPFTDSQIAEIMSEEGLKISRRTVTKYRNEINIPSVKQRVSTVSP